MAKVAIFTNVRDKSEIMRCYLTAKLTACLLSSQTDSSAALYGVGAKYLLFEMSMKRKRTLN